ncbi:MAG TPA: polysaccharide biosynthesis/export family protein [Phycisphaerales bacterium]|nr:polysaccharide biosynthesis/export family protein [Phycisphaerales bacterium]
MRTSPRSSPRRTVRCTLCLASLAGLACAALSGCSLDNYLDPSVVGRWEATPTVVPILERLASIEDVEEGFVEYSDVTAADLVPQSEEYRVGPGDSLDVIAFDLVLENQREQYLLLVDNRGYIDVPQLGAIYVNGMTVPELRGKLEAAASRLVRNPLIQVTVAAPRQRSYNVLGAVNGPGPYLVPDTEHRLLDALTAASGFAETATYIYVIRQAPLASPDTTAPPTPAAQPQRGGNGAGLIDLIDELTGDGGGAPGVTSAGRVPAVTGARRTGQPESPPIDLVDSTLAPARRAPQPTTGDGTSWMFLNGQWVQVRTSAATPNGAPSQDGSPEPMVTQRTIRVPVKPLMNGDARYNIIIRPGDVIRVPFPDRGELYIAGQVQRPGVYNLPFSGRITLIRAIDAAGGLGPIAIPERVEVTRMVGPDRQATIQLNYRAINEGTQPDIFLKPDDRINVGTNFWALPLAVVRNGFRASYGFGFFLDRNFGNDVFGAPPVRRSN